MSFLNYRMKNLFDFQEQRIRKIVVLGVCEYEFIRGNDYKLVFIVMDIKYCQYGVF